MNGCEDCPISLPCWGGMLLNGEKGRVAFPKRVEDRAVWQESVTMCPVCEQLCIIEYKYGRAIEAFDEGRYAPPAGCAMLRPGDAFYFEGVHIGQVTQLDGDVVSISRRSLNNATSSRLDGQDFTFERHPCPGRQQTTREWEIWYAGYLNEGSMHVLQKHDSAPSAHPGDKIWVKICPKCLTEYIDKADRALEGCWTKEELVLMAPGSVLNSANRVWGLKTAMLNTKAEAVPGWSDVPLHRTYWPRGCPFPHGVYQLEQAYRYEL